MTIMFTEEEKYKERDEKVYPRIIANLGDYSYLIQVSEHKAYTYTPHNKAKSKEMVIQAFLKMSEWEEYTGDQSLLNTFE